MVSLQRLVRSSPLCPSSPVPLEVVAAAGLAGEYRADLLYRLTARVQKFVGVGAIPVVAVVDAVAVVVSVDGEPVVVAAAAADVVGAVVAAVAVAVAVAAVAVAVDNATVDCGW